MRCRLCDSDRLLSALDLGVTPPREKSFTVDELDRPELTFTLHGGYVTRTRVRA